MASKYDDDYDARFPGQHRKKKSGNPNSGNLNSGNFAGNLTGNFNRSARPQNSAKPQNSPGPYPGHRPSQNRGQNRGQNPGQRLRQSVQPGMPNQDASPKMTKRVTTGRAATGQPTLNARMATDSSGDPLGDPTTKKWFGRMPVSLMGLRWLRSWPMIVLIVFGILGTAGTTAVVSLFRVPNLPNCRAIFWPTASASLRLQCAEAHADEGDVANLLAAIALVDKLPEDHPLRSDIINDRIESWANQVLDLAERSFEEGELDVAVNTAKKIPQRTAAAKVVEERIARWQTIWKDGEDGFNAAIEKLKEKNFQKAFSLSVTLLDVENKFWSTDKYNELTKLISLAREDSRKMSKALGLAKQGTVKGYVAALKKLKEIGEGSVFYAEAQGKRKDIAKEMLEQGESFLSSQQLSEAQAMLNAIPRDTGLDREIADFQVFVTAYQQAWTNNVVGLTNAINRMKTLGRDRPSYAKGQRLIARWEVELQNIALLNEARERAGRGSTSDLTAAISVAQKVTRNSPQWDEATEQIGDWQARVETVQDRPILERADRLAAVGSPDNLRAAIQEARKVSSDRSLGQEAEERIANWTERIQRIEDQPILNQARARARTGDTAGAIAIANRIGEGRSLYEAAQDDIANWQAQVDGRARLSEAVEVAARGDGDSLARAIGIAQRVPSRSDNRRQADGQITQWSWTLLQQAESLSQRNIEKAIALASQIPSGTEAYNPAQVRIGNWQATLRRIEESRQPASAPSPTIVRPDARTDGRQEGAPAVPPEVGENGLPDSLELRSPDDE
ncbi:MAG: chromosome segregation ATPase [Cyanobacteria bacterium P01_F01_bin.53]